MARSKKRKKQSGVEKPKSLGATLAGQLIVGQRVIVTKETGEEVETFVMTYPWQNGNGDWVIGLEGFKLVYDITRVRPASGDARVHAIVKTRQVKRRSV